MGLFGASSVAMAASHSSWRHEMESCEIAWWCFVLASLVLVSSGIADVWVSSSSFHLVWRHCWYFSQVLSFQPFSVSSSTQLMISMSSAAFSLRSARDLFWQIFVCHIIIVVLAVAWNVVSWGLYQWVNFLIDGCIEFWSIEARWSLWWFHKVFGFGIALDIFQFLLFATEQHRWLPLTGFTRKLSREVEIV